MEDGVEEVVELQEGEVKSGRRKKREKEKK